jgi:hypothetical protein
MRQQATVVLFTDDVGEIRYVWGRFNTPLGERGGDPPRLARGGVRSAI